MALKIVEHKSELSIDSAVHYPDLTENNQQIKMVSGISTIGDKGEITFLTPVVRCLDYFTDFLYAHWEERPIRAHGYEAEPLFYEELDRETISHTYVVPHMVSEERDALLGLVQQLAEKIHEHTGKETTIHFHGTTELVGSDLTEDIATSWNWEGEKVDVISMEYPKEAALNSGSYHACNTIFRAISGAVQDGEGKDYKLYELPALRDVTQVGVDILGYLLDSGESLRFDAGKDAYEVHSGGGCRSAAGALKAALIFTHLAPRYKVICGQPIDEEFAKRYIIPVTSKELLQALEELAA